MLRALIPELIYAQGELLRNHALLADDGILTHICHTHALPPDAERVLLPRRALFPGFVNAHSHAFQRAIRARTQRRAPGGLQDTFWSWREAMYGVAQTLSPDGIYDIARMAFLDMLRTGFTAVGEFHYLHHQPSGEPYDNPNELALRVIQAAQDVGIRIVLLRVAYARAGFDQPANPRQRRFIEASPEVYLSRVSDLRTAVRRLDPAGEHVAVGLAPHSIRALDDTWLTEIAAHLRAHPMPVHMHVSEQRGELEQCRAEHGTTPLAHLHALMDLGALHFTAVHGTHLTPHEIEIIAEADSIVCACPITERDLGDGFLPGLELLNAGVPMAIGTDSHCQIDPFAELRLIEYHERLRRESRNLMAPPEALEPAHYLFDIGTRWGAHALDLPTGELEPGKALDAFTLDLSHRTVLGCRDDDLLAALVFAADPGAVKDVFIAGKRCLEDGHHPEEEAIEEAYLRLCTTALSGH